MNRDEQLRVEWCKSGRSTGQNNCVEVAFLDDGRVAARDSKERGEGDALVFSAGSWLAFTARAKAGELRPL